MLPRVRPMDLLRLRAPFDDPDFIFEVKFDGFRALAYVENGRCRLVSRKGRTYKRFFDLAQQIAAGLNAESAILDGEIVCLDDQGRSRFYDLLFRRAEPYLYAFDLLWLDGQDLRGAPLVERKSMLRKILPPPPSGLLYLDHIEEQGVELFEKCCELDLEGIVAKPKLSPYRQLSGGPCWVKIRNPEYTQAERREALFNARR